MRLLKLKIFKLLITALLFISCSKDHNTREYEIMADMAHSYAVKAQEESAVDSGQTSMRVPPVGTIPRGFQPYMQATPEEAGQNLLNPLSSSTEVLQTGKRYYDINCQPCHGKLGAGDGNVITKASFNQRMPAPPVLYSKKLMDYPDGQLFHIITKGQGNMPAYANRVDVNTRWAIVNYVRVLQEAAKTSN